MNEKLEKICGIAYSYKETVYDTYNQAKQLIEKNVEGVFVECGVAAGAQVFAMQVANEEYPVEKRRRIYGFDSFQGIPLAGAEDTEQPAIGAITHDKYAPISERLVSSGVTVHTLDNVLQNLNTFFPQGAEEIIFHKGWFQHTVPYAPAYMDKIALLRLDGDLYESTMVCLEVLYPLVSVFGVVIIDDYGLEGCRKAVHDYFYKKGLPLPDFKPVIGSGTVVYFHKF